MTLLVAFLLPFTLAAGYGALYWWAEWLDEKQRMREALAIIADQRSRIDDLRASNVRLADLIDADLVIAPIDWVAVDLHTREAKPIDGWLARN
jgi:hypothetical protein